MSRSGDNSAGTSWASAWNELANINWALVHPGDTVLVDGGATSCGSNVDITAGQPGTNCGMVYGTPLTVGASGTASAPITIRLAGDAGHNGTAVVFGGRATALPYCDQSSYSPVGVGRAAGIAVPGRSNVIIDGTHRSGFMVYGAQNGVDLASDSTSFVTLRNLEIFDNGTYSTWAYGYFTDGDGVLLAGHDITIDRDLIHDNGQDEIHDRYTGPVNNNSHAALYNIAVTNSWMYVRRDHPQFTGYGFNAGSQDITAQNCQHVDGIQIWGGGLHQHNLTVDHDVFGPLIAQGVYPGNRDTTSFDNVTVTNSLFLVLDHSIIGDSIASDPTTPANWLVADDTSFMTDQPPTGTNSHGKIDLAGTGHTIRNSVFYNGYYYTVNPATASGNVWWKGDPVPGAVNQNPGFAGPLPGTNVPTYAQYVGMNLSASCAACGVAGAPIATTSGLLAAIDSANGVAP